MSWQDWVLAFLELWFAVVLFPMLRRGASRPPISSSATTAAGLAVMAVTFFTLALYWATALTAFASLIWAEIAVLKWRERVSLPVKDDTKTGLPTDGERRMFKG